MGDRERGRRGVAKRRRVERERRSNQRRDPTPKPDEKPKRKTRLHQPFPFPRTRPRPLNQTQRTIRHELLQILVSDFVAEVSDVDPVLSDGSSGELGSFLSRSVEGTSLGSRRVSGSGGSGGRHGGVLKEGRRKLKEECVSSKGGTDLATSR